MTQIKGTLIDFRVDPSVAPGDFQRAESPGELEREPQRLRVQRNIALAPCPLLGFDSPPAQIETQGGVQILDIKMDGRDPAQQKSGETRADFVDQPLSQLDQLFPRTRRVGAIWKVRDLLKVRLERFERVALQAEALLTRTSIAVV